MSDCVQQWLLDGEGKMAGAGLRTSGAGVGGKAQGGGGGQYRIREPQELLKATTNSLDAVLARR